MNIVLLIFLFHLFTIGNGITCPGPVEEGESTTLTCQSDTPKFTWQLKRTTDYTAIMECANDTCSNDEYTVSTRKLTIGNDAVYESRLRIKQVLRNTTAYKCRPVDETCELEVYVPPRGLRCQSSAGHYGFQERSYFDTRCLVEESYPKPSCYMKMTSTNGSKYEYKMITDSSVQQPNGNYKTSFSFQIPLAGLQPDMHYFTAFAYPGISINVTNAMAVDGTIAPILLSTPTVILSKDCQLREISGTANCSCELTHSGYPEGWINWFTSSNSLTGTLGNRNATTLTLSQSSIASRPTFTCSPVSTLGRLGPCHVYTALPASSHCKDPEKILL